MKRETDLPKDILKGFKGKRPFSIIM